MIKDSLALLLTASPALLAEAKFGKPSGTRFVFPNAETTNDNGYNQTIDFNSTQNSYNGPLYVGTPLQWDTNIKTAYDTGSPETLVPASNCVGCPNNWFDEGSSSTYVAGSN